MPKLFYKGRILLAQEGERVRDVIHRHTLSAHNGKSQWLNCRGLGTCGTCAMLMEPEPEQPLSPLEKWRLGFYPHKPGSLLRLACQVKVETDMHLTKFPGFWGEEFPERE